RSNVIQNGSVRKLILDRHLTSIDGKVVIQSGHHVENPLGAKFQKPHFERWITVEHAVAHNGDERHHGGKAHADSMRVQKPVTNFGEGRVAHAHMETQRETPPMGVNPPPRQTRMTKKAVTCGAVDHSSGGPQLTHLFYSFTALFGIA